MFRPLTPPHKPICPSQHNSPEQQSPATAVSVSVAIAVSPEVMVMVGVHGVCVVGATEGGVLIRVGEVLVVVRWEGVRLPFRGLWVCGGGGRVVWEVGCWA